MKVHAIVSMAVLMSVLWHRVFAGFNGGMMSSVCSSSPGPCCHDHYSMLQSGIKCEIQSPQASPSDADCEFWHSVYGYSNIKVITVFTIIIHIQMNSLVDIDQCMTRPLAL